MVKVSAHGVVFILVLLWSALIGSIALISPSLILLFLPFEATRRVYRMWTGFVAQQWFTIATFLLERWCKVRIVLSGDELPKGEEALVVCNHRTRIDWMFMWCLCLRLGILDTMKIVLKDSLKSWPAFGWAMQSFMFVFLARDKSKDLQHMEDVLSYHTSNHHPLSLVLFPEGTDLSPTNMERSNAYAAQNKLPKYKYVLHPKVVGWSRSVALLRDTCTAVYEVTIAYHDFEEGKRTSEASLLAARYPKEVHLHVQRHKMALLPEAPAELEQWCRRSFQLREKRLQQFYTGPRKFGPEVPAPLSQEELERAWRNCLLFWLAGSVVSGLALLLLVGWAWTLTAALVWVILTRLGGADAIELRMHGEQGLYRTLLNKGPAEPQKKLN